MDNYANTASTHPTHFLRGTDLIREARNTFKLQSENWPYPTDYRIGTAKDRYYAEVWSDGMDWTKNFWVIETCKHSTPKCIPLMYFEDHAELDSWETYDFRQSVEALLCVRRDRLWLQKNDYSWYGDTVWPYLKRDHESTTERDGGLVKCYFEHASQERVEFWVNKDFLP